MKIYTVKELKGTAYDLGLTHGVYRDDGEGMVEAVALCYGEDAARDVCAALMTVEVWLACCYPDLAEGRAR